MLPVPPIQLINDVSGGLTPGSLRRTNGLDYSCEVYSPRPLIVYISDVKQLEPISV